MISNEPLLQSDKGLSPHLVVEIYQECKQLYPELYALQHDIHEHPELAWEEDYAHKVCTDYMEKAGWKVTRQAYGMRTAWEARFESCGGGPVIGFNSEMDALKGIGHACGHNLIAIAGIAAAISAAKVLERHGIPGTVKLLGTPAEEAFGGKITLLKQGAYDDMEACFMTHPASRGHGTGVHTLSARVGLTVSYHGASAHAGGNPEKGINALDAAVAAYTNIALVRQQLPPGVKVHNIIKGSEKWSTNVIASESKLAVGLRCENAGLAEVAVAKVIKCLEAAAIATGCTFDIHQDGMYMDLRHSSALKDYFKQVCGEAWDDYPVSESHVTASTDFGNVAYHLPALHPIFELPEARAGDFPHSDTFAQWTDSVTATQAALKSASSIAAVAMRMVVDRKWAASVQESWKKEMEAINGPETLVKLEELVGKYPLSAEADRAFCCDH